MYTRFNVFYLKRLFLLHVSVTQDHHQAVNVGIRLVIELQVWIHSSATCHVRVYKVTELPQVKNKYYN
jgi:hypothetical protein